MSKADAVAVRKFLDALEAPSGAMRDPDEYRCIHNFVRAVEVQGRLDGIADEELAARVSHSLLALKDHADELWKRLIELYNEEARKP